MVIGHLLTTPPLEPDEPAQPLRTLHRLSWTLARPRPSRNPLWWIHVDASFITATIENRSATLPEPIASAMGPWVAAVTSARTSVPWNHRTLPSSDDPDLQPRPWLLDLKKEDVLNWDDASWDERLRGSALRRIKPWMWRRNAEVSDPDRPTSL